MENMKQYTAETALFQKAGFNPGQANLLAVGFTGMHQRLTDMDARIDQRFEAFDQRLTDMDARIDQRLTDMDARIDQRLDGVETRITAIEETLRSLPWKVIGYTTAVVGALMAVQSAILISVLQLILK